MGGHILNTTEIRNIPAHINTTALMGAGSACAKKSRQWPEGVFFCGHLGSSMNPTLSELDMLEIMPSGDMPIRAGDIILFLPLGMHQPIAHRVLTVTKEGIRTRGDNNSAEDRWLVKHTEVVGRVVAAWRGYKRRRIPGGWTGLLLASLTRGGRGLFRGARHLLGPIYGWLIRWRIVCRLLPNRLRPRVIIFCANGCSHLQLLLGRRVVGRYDPRRSQWLIKGAFRLLVDEAVLSENLCGLNPSDDGKRAHDA
jgi:signal peptidase I